MCPAEINRDRLAAALLRRCRSEKVEPPASGQVERVVASGWRRFDEAFAAAVAERLGPVVCGRLEDLLRRPDVLADLKSDRGPLGLDTLLTEIGKLATVRALGLTAAVFADTSDRIVAACRARVGGLAVATTVSFGIWWRHNQIGLRLQLGRRQAYTGGKRRCARLILADPVAALGTPLSKST